MTEEFLDKMEQNPLALSSFFESYIRGDRVATQLGLLSDLRELISADSVGGFVLAYSAILSGSVDVQPSLVEKLASTRQNIGNKDIYEIAQQCREIYNKRKKHLMPKTSIAAQSDTSKVAGFAGIMKKYANKLKAMLT